MLRVNSRVFILLSGDPPLPLPPQGQTGQTDIECMFEKFKLHQFACEHLIYIIQSELGPESCNCYNL
jgi:hypothetical protein